MTKKSFSMLMIALMIILIVGLPILNNDKLDESKDYLKYEYDGNNFLNDNDSIEIISEVLSVERYPLYVQVDFFHNYKNFLISRPFSIPIMKDEFDYDLFSSIVKGKLKSEDDTMQYIFTLPKHEANIDNEIFRFIKQEVEEVINKEDEDAIKDTVVVFHIVKTYEQLADFLINTPDINIHRDSYPSYTYGFSNEQMEKFNSLKGSNISYYEFYEIFNLLEYVENEFKKFLKEAQFPNEIIDNFWNDRINKLKSTPFEW
ncbi:MAG: hypothetical protein N4A68_15735 [Maledivibacter sp.]|jgi:hypothetical protein|nr:hypothetical protein [Maledivibacter sp.]